MVKRAMVLVMVTVLLGAIIAAWQNRSRTSPSEPVAAPSPGRVGAADAPMPGGESPAPPGSATRGGGVPHRSDAAASAARTGLPALRPDAVIDCRDPRDERALAVCEERMTQVLRDYSRAVKDFQDKLAPTEARLYGTAEFASEYYRLAECQFEASLLSATAETSLRGENSYCVMDLYQARTQAIQALAERMSDYSAVPKERSPEDAARLSQAAEELDKVREELLRTLGTGPPVREGSAPMTELFAAAQSAWGEFRAAECKAQAAMYSAQYGSAGGAYEACLIRMTQDRVAKIRSLVRE